jgi:hypothetical protein
MLLRAMTFRGLIVPDDPEHARSDGKAEDAGGVVAQQGLGGEA